MNIKTALICSVERQNRQVARQHYIMAAGADQEQVVTPWEAHAGEGQAAIDYGKLISK